MFYATFDPNKQGDNIKGFYPLTSTDVPKPAVQITEKQRDNILKFPGHFRIESGRLIQLKDTKQELQRRQLNDFRKDAASKNKAPLVVKDFKYFVDSVFMDNLNLNLNVCSVDDKHKCSLWRINPEGSWEFVEHDKQLLVEIAIAFNSRRESISKELYGQAAS